MTVEGAGFLLNNEMDDFTTRPGSPNLYGLVQGERNAIEPGKRMLSAMTPTVVEDPEGNLLMVVGSPGGSTIITTVFQVISNVLDFGMSLPQAVNAPRVHHQHLPDRIQFERGGLPPAVVDSLRAMGHEMDERGGTSGDVKAILVLPEGSLAGYADPPAGRTRGGVLIHGSRAEEPDAWGAGHRSAVSRTGSMRDGVTAGRETGPYLQAPPPLRIPGSFPAQEVRLTDVLAELNGCLRSDPKPLNPG